MNTKDENMTVLHVTREEWPKHPPPKEVWFHFHPQPGMYPKELPEGITDIIDSEIPAPEGELWSEPFMSYEEALKELQRRRGPNGKCESAEEDGWIVVGPYTLGGWTIPGWTCKRPACGLFNGEMKESRATCRGCGGENNG